MSINVKKLFTVLFVICLTVMVAVPAFAETVSVSLDIDPEDECVEGDEVVFTAAAEGFDNPEYSFLYRKAPGGTVHIGQRGDENVWTPTAPGGSAGFWDFAVQVKEKGESGWPGIGDPGFDWFQGYEILVPEEPSVTLTIDPADTAVEGQEVTFTAQSENVANPEYRFAYRASGTTTPIYFPQTGPNSVWTITIPAGAAGTYDIGVQVRESGTGGWSSPPVHDIFYDYVITEEPDPDLEVISVEAISLTVDYGTVYEDIDFPETVEAELDDQSTIDANVDWAEESVPAYDPEVPGVYVFEGELVDLPEGVINPDELKAEATVTVDIKDHELYLKAERVKDGDAVEIWLRNNTDEDLVFDQVDVRKDTDEPVVEDVGLVNQVDAGEDEMLYSFIYDDVGNYLLTAWVLIDDQPFLTEDFNIIVTDELYEAEFMVEDPDEVALEGAIVKVKSDLMEDEKTTDADGIALFDDLFGDDTYEYTVELDNYYTEEGTFEITDENVEVDVTLTPYADVTIIVEDEEGVEIEGATVALDEREESTDVDGVALFEAVEEGEYLVEVSRIGYLDGTKEITVTREDAEFTVVLTDSDDVTVELVEDEIKAGEQQTVKMVNNSTTVIEIDNEAQYRSRKWDAENNQWGSWSSYNNVVCATEVPAQDEKVLFSTDKEFKEVGDYELQVLLYDEGSVAFDETLDFTVVFAEVDPESPVSVDPASLTVGNASTVTVELEDIEGNTYSGLTEEDFIIGLDELVTAGLTNNDNNENNDNGAGAEVVDGSFTEDPEEPGTYTFDVYNETAETVIVTIEVLEVALDDKPTIEFLADTAVKLAIAKQPTKGFIYEELLYEENVIADFAVQSNDEGYGIVVVAQDEYDNFSNKGLPSALSVLVEIEDGPEGADLYGEDDLNIGMGHGQGKVNFNDLSVNEIGTYTFKFYTPADALQSVISDEIEVGYDEDNPVYLYDADEYKSKHTDIQSAIDAANDPGTVLVYPGIYPEDVTVNFDGLMLKSVEKHEAVIEGYVAIEADDVTFEDFHVDYTTSTVNAPIDLINSENLTIRGNKIEGGADTGGISTWTGPAHIRGDVLIEANEIIEGPIGLILNDDVADVIIRDNVMTEPGDEGIWVWQNDQAELTIEANTVTDAGENDVKIVDKPISINGETDEANMEAAILDANPGIDSVLLEWLE